MGDVSSNGGTSIQKENVSYDDAKYLAILKTLFKSLDSSDPSLMSKYCSPEYYSALHQKILENEKFFEDYDIIIVVETTGDYNLKYRKKDNVLQVNICGTFIVSFFKEVDSKKPNPPGIVVEDNVNYDNQCYTLFFDEVTEKLTGHDEDIWGNPVGQVK